MGGDTPFTERYLLKLAYYTLTEPALNQSDAVPFHSHNVMVRVTNTEDRLLTKRNLQSLALSIPSLHHRISGDPHPLWVLHQPEMQVQILPTDYTPPRRPRVHQSSRSQWCSNLQIQAPRGTAKEQSNADAAPGTSPEEHPVLSEVENSTPQISDWLCCDGSFVPDVADTEWTFIAFGERDFIRSVSPVPCTDPAVDIRGRCSVNDYTAYGQLVFSVHMDFLLETTAREPKAPSPSLRSKGRNRHHERLQKAPKT